MSVLSADDDDAQRLESMLANIARGLGAAPAHLEAAAGLLGDERPEPTTRQLVDEALDRDANLRDRYRRQLRLLADGLPTYTDASGRPVPAQPGFGDRGPSRIPASQLQDLSYAVGRHAAAMKLLAAAVGGRLLKSYDADAHGRGAERNFRLAVRAFFRRSEVRRWIREDPARQLKIKPGGATFAEHITAEQYDEIHRVASTTGDDPELDGLLTELLRRAALRQEAEINLTLDALDRERGRLRVSTKWGHTQDLPVNRHFLDAVYDLACARGSQKGSDAAFRYRDGRPLTGRRFDTIFRRVKKQLPWAAPLTIGPHTIRRLTLTELERRHGLAVATVWAGHRWESLPPIFRYLAKPTDAELVAAAVDLFGPLDAPVPAGPPAAGPFAVPHGFPPTVLPDTRAAASEPAAQSADHDGEPRRRRRPRSTGPRPIVPPGDAPLVGCEHPANPSPGDGETQSSAAPGWPLFCDEEEQ